MALARLYFSGSTQPELVRFVFEHAILKRQIESVRGKSEGAYAQHGTFQWSPAVRALCVLMLKTKQSALLKRPEKPILQAHTRGAISALDYAIGRGARWTSDFFGCDSNGRPLARRVFARSNPERKRPGPVAIAINERFLSPQQIEIVWEDRNLCRSEECETLESRLLSHGEWELGRISFARSASSSVSPGPASLHQLRSGFVREAQLMLRATNIFSARAVRSALGELERTPALHAVKKEIIAGLEASDFTLASAQRLGISSQPPHFGDALHAEAPLRFGVTPSQIGTLALLRYLRDIRKLPIEIDFSFAHTSDLARGIARGGSQGFPECCVMTTASFSLLAPKLRREYRPLMIMPAATHAIIGSAMPHPDPQHLSQGEYHFLHDFPTTPGFWFDSLRRDGLLSTRHLRVVHSEPDDTLAALRTKDPAIRAILWFPYNLIATVAAEAQPLLQAPAENSGLGFLQNMLFVHESLARNSSRRLLLDVVIRDAWLRLLEDEALCSSVVHAQLDDPEYRRSLWRYSGLYRVEGALAA